MGTFSNGTEGGGFRELWCDRCAHDTHPDSEKQCAVWMLHLAYNSDQHAAYMVGEGNQLRHGPTLKHLLAWLIHEKADEMGAQECAMFMPRGDARITGGDAWCESFRHHQRIDERNAGVPCLFCMAENGALHLETSDAY